MAHSIHLEGAGDIEIWPPNEPGKPTQVAVFGMYHPDKGKCCEILFTGKFPILDSAMCWGAKKELHAVCKRLRGRFAMKPPRAFTRSPACPIRPKTRTTN